MADQFQYKPWKRMLPFHSDDTSLIRMLHGCVGSGKSLASMGDLFYRASTSTPSPDGVRRSRFAILRASYPLLKSTTLPTFRALVGTEAAIATGNSPITYTVRSKGLEASFLFLAIEEEIDIQKLLSMELTGALVSESSTMRFKELVTMLSSRIGRYPSPAQGGVIPKWSGIILEGHRPTPGSWQDTMMEAATKDVPNPDGVACYSLPPGATLNSDGVWTDSPPEDCNPYLLKNYYRRLINSGAETDWLKRYVGNERVFTVSGEAVFANEFRDSLHVLDDVFEPDPETPLHVAVDPDLYGSALVYQTFTGGRFVCVDELFNEQEGIIRFAQNIVQHIASTYPDCSVGSCWADPAAKQRGVDNRSALELLRLNSPYKWSGAPLPKNELSIRLEVVRHGLTTLGALGKPLLQISPRCKKLRAAMAGLYRFKTSTSAGDTVVSKQVAKGKDGSASIAESLQYGLLGAGVGGIVRGRAERSERARTGEVLIAQGVQESAFDLYGSDRVKPIKHSMYKGEVYLS